MTERDTEIKREVICTRYRTDRHPLLEIVKERKGMRHKSQVLEYALDRLLEQEGLLDAA